MAPLRKLTLISREKQSPPSRFSADTSASASSYSFRDDSTTDVSSVDTRKTSFEPSHIGLDNRAMSQEKWSILAHALGIPAADDYRPNVDARKLASKVSKRRNGGDKHTAEAFHALVSSIAQSHPQLKACANTSFNRDAVPEEVPSFVTDKPWKIRLPTPKPTVAIGYMPEIFDSHHWELQQGIICDRRGEPRDLSRISQTAPGIFWPFLVVQVQNESMLAARNACAGATATCNNALMMLIGAIVDEKSPSYDEAFLTSLTRAVHSFSLAVSGKKACLMTHNSEGPLAQAVGTIRSYKLDDEKEVEALTSRIKSIFIWASQVRLPAIVELLDKFDKRVRFRESVLSQETSRTGPMDLVGQGAAYATQKSVKRKGLIKAVLADSMPAWTRIEV